MNITHLEAFICIAEVGSFNKAAESLFISSTAVIKQINMLENEVGVPLFLRTHRGLRLTAAGKSLYKDAKYMVEYSKEALRRAKKAGVSESSVIRIGTSPMTPAQLLTDLWPKIHEHCRDMSFQLVPFENTRENAREILKNLGQNIDVVSGIFDDTLLKLRECDGLEITRARIACAVSIYHPLAKKDRLTINDLYGEKLMIIKRNWSRYMDILRDELEKNHRQINISDFDFYDISIFNRCEQENNILIVIDKWKNLHPLLKTIPVEWDYTIPFGILCPPSPSDTVSRFLTAVKEVTAEKS